MKKIILIPLLFLSVIAFSQSSDATMTTQANVIRNENTPGGNTKTRIADMFQALIDSKVSLIKFPVPGTLGSANQLIRVNGAGTGLEYYTPSGGGTWGSITGTLSDQTDLQSALDAKQTTITFGTGVQTALGINIGSAGAPVLFNGAGGTPSSMTGTNITGIPYAGHTGTAPFWSLASGGTLTGTNTISAGTNPIIFTSGVTTGTGATAGWQYVANSLTTGNGLDVSSSTLSGGNLVYLSSNSTSAASSTQTLFRAELSGANASSGQTTAAIRITNTHTGTTSTNYGLVVEASGGTNNYAIQAVGGIRSSTLTSGQIAIVTFGGEITSSSDFVWSSTQLQVTSLRISGTGNGLTFQSRGNIVPPSNGVLTLYNSASNDFTRLQFGGTTSSFPSIKRNSTAIDIRLADDSGYAPLNSGNLSVTGTVKLGASSTSAYVWTATDGSGNGAWIAPSVSRAGQTVTLFNDFSGFDVNHFFREINTVSASTSGSFGIAVTNTEITDGGSVTIVVKWTLKDDSSNTGAGGTFTSAWTKSGTTLHKVYDDNYPVAGSDTGDAIVLSSSDVSGDIVIGIGTGTVGGNFSASAIAEVIIMKP